MAVTEVVFTASDMAEFSGYSPKQIRNLCETGVLIPVTDPAGGPGHFRYFGLMQLVAIVFVGMTGSKSLTREQIEPLMDFVMDFSERELSAEFRKKRTHVLLTDKGYKLVEWKQPQICPSHDLKMVYKGVKRKLGTISAKVVREGRGRRRGLATSAKQ